MMCKIQHAMQDDTIRTVRILPAVHPGNRVAKFRARLEKPRSREPSQPALSYEHNENFTKDLEVRQDLGNRASRVNRAHMKRPLIEVSL